MIPIILFWYLRHGRVSLLYCVGHSRCSGGRVCVGCHSLAVITVIAAAAAAAAADFVFC